MLLLLLLLLVLTLSCCCCCSYACYRSSTGTPPLAISQCTNCVMDGRNTNCSTTAPAPSCDYCCPANYTEAFYEDPAHPERYATHPPTLLAQLTQYDQNADLCGAKSYHETMLSHGVSSEFVGVAPADEDCFCIGNPARCGCCSCSCCCRSCCCSSCCSRCCIC